MSLPLSIRRLLRQSPLALRLHGRWRKKAHWCLAGPDTEVVIEGFPRSANTFARYAFQFAQGSPRKVATHFHMPSQVIYAARHRIPCIVLMREPEDALLSLAQRHPEFPLARSVDDYIHFHAAIWPYRERFVVGFFEEVTADFGKVTARLNEKFGKSFACFEPTEENLAEVQTRIRAFNERAEGGNEDQLAVPSEERRKRRAQMREEALARLEAAGLPEAREWYRRYREAFAEPETA